MTESTYPVSAPKPQTPATTTTSTARFMLPAEGFALADLFERVPDARIKCEPAVANPTDHALLVVQSENQERAISAALRSDPNIAAVEYFGGRSDEWTYRVTWQGRPRQLIQRLVAADVTLLSIRGRGGEWKLRLLAPDRDGISQAHDIMVDFGSEADCLSITTFDGSSSIRSGLTDEQRETLLEAFETGYYNIPRDITAEGLSDRLGISHQALSERFRRAYRQLIETELAINNEQGN